MRPRLFRLYRIYDGQGELLYVGKTDNPRPRITTGHRAKDWWPEIAHIALEAFDDAEQLGAAERSAIQEEQPRHNIIRFRERPPARIRLPRQGKAPKVVLPSVQERRGVLREAGWECLSNSGSGTWRHERYGSGHWFSLAKAYRTEIGLYDPDAVEGVTG